MEEDDGGPLLARPALQLAYNSVRLYISAIQRLYEEQKSRNINPAPRPQGIALKALKKSILAVVWARRRAEYEDRLEGTIKDSYTKAQVPQHHAAAWQVDGDISCLLRTQVDFLLGNHMLLRQSNRRPMELPDCFRSELPNEGQKSREFPTYALVVVINQGKTNQHGRMEYGAALRHRDVRSCLVGALASRGRRAVSDVSAQRGLVRLEGLAQVCKRAGKAALAADCKLVDAETVYALRDQNLQALPRSPCCGGAERRYGRGVRRTSKSRVLQVGWLLRASCLWKRN